MTVAVAAEIRISHSAARVSAAPAAAPRSLSRQVRDNMTRQYEYAPAYSEGPIVRGCPVSTGWPAIGRDSGVEDCIQRARIMSGNIYSERGGLLEKLHSFGMKPRGGGGSVTLEYHRTVRTPVRTQGRYVFLERYVPGEDTYR